jgi:CheY-like chemotaxis protein
MSSTGIKDERAPWHRNWVPATRLALALPESRLRTELAGALRADGHVVYEAGSSAELFAVMTQAMMDRGRGALPAAIILPVQAPELDGRAIRRRLRDAGWDTGFVLIGEPPAEAAQPTEAERSVVVAWPPTADELRAALAVVLHPNAGRWN